MRIGEGPTATDRDEAGVSDLREDHRRHLYPLPPLTPLGRIETPKLRLVLMNTSKRRTVERQHQ
jgi:hypothetical protein